MRIIVFITFLTLLFDTQSQIQTGSLKGVLYGKNTDPLKGIYYSMEIPSKDEAILLRTEFPNSKNVALKKANFKRLAESKIEITETVVTQKSRTNTISWCKFKINIHLDTTDGFWKGTYSSTDCANQMGEVIFYRTDDQWEKDVNTLNSITSTTQIIQNFKDGLTSPDKMQLDRKNFKFKPIYFDFDQAIIKEDYKTYLIKLGQMVKGHSDIRIRIIGHTDAIGSDQYNDALSLRRTKAIQAFFNENGVPTHRLVFDFKGEKSPIATNDSAEGRQLNRRVDFEFIYE